MPPSKRPRTTLQRGGDAELHRPVVGVFAREPTPGRTKTRLAVAIGDEPAAAVAQAMTEATLRRLAANAIDADRVVPITPATSAAWFDRQPGVIDGGWTVVAQPAGSLGDRMRWFFESVAQKRPALLLGSDSPDFSIDTVVDAIGWLSNGEGLPRTAIAPADDGGYWAIGVAGSPPPVFGELPWGQPSLLAETIDRLDAWQGKGLGDYRLLADGYDVDTTDDLARLRQHLRRIQDRELVRLRDRLDELLGPLPGRDDA